MKIHLYTISWNEADMLGFFFRHYDPWVDRYFIYDDGSTDGTLEALKSHPRMELRKFERTDPGSFVASHQKMQNNSWKESRKEADWIVMTAIDEHLHVPGISMRDYLERNRSKGVTLLHGMGFQMVSEDFPGESETLCQTRTIGCPYARLSRLSIFNQKRSGKQTLRVNSTAPIPRETYGCQVAIKYSTCITRTLDSNGSSSVTGN